MHTYRAWVAVALVSGASVVAGRTAYACEAVCGHPEARPVAPIPANVPALIVSYPLNVDASVDELALKDDTGALVPVTIESMPWSYGNHVLLKPQSALRAERSYTVEFLDACQTALGSALVRTSASVPFPTTTAGSVAITNVTGSVQVPSSNGGCTEAIEVPTARVAFTPSAELMPWLPVTRYTTVVDGAVWATTRYGSTAPAAFTAERDAFQFYSTCKKTEGLYANAPPGLEPGHHQGRLDVEIAGQVALSIPFELALECPTEASGCNVSGSPGSAWLVAGVVALWWLARGRRSRPGGAGRARE